MGRRCLHGDACTEMFARRCLQGGACTEMLAWRCSHGDACKEALAWKCLCVVVGSRCPRVIRCMRKGLCPEVFAHMRLHVWGARIKKHACMYAAYLYMHSVTHMCICIYIHVLTHSHICVVRTYASNAACAGNGIGASQGLAVVRTRMCLCVSACVGAC